MDIQPDSIVTVSSWFNGQSKGAVVIPDAQPFPLSVKDDFDSYKLDAEARFFADNGGSFQVAEDPTGQQNGNMVLKQWVMQENGVNRWGYNVRLFFLCKCMLVSHVIVVCAMLTVLCGWSTKNVARRVCISKLFVTSMVC